MRGLRLLEERGLLRDNKRKRLKMKRFLELRLLKRLLKVNFSI